LLAGFDIYPDIIIRHLFDLFDTRTVFIHKIQQGIAFKVGDGADQAFAEAAVDIPVLFVPDQYFFKFILPAVFVS